MITNETLKKVNELLSNGKILNCFALLEENIDYENKARILILKNQFATNNQEKEYSIISNEDYNVSVAKIILKLTQIINELKNLIKVKIYFIGHSSKDMTPVSFENEYNAIKEVVKNSSDLTLSDKIISSLDELNLLLAEQGEVILHFACHGNIGGLFLSDENGVDKYETNTTILEFLRPFSLRIKGIILNACLSKNLGEKFVNNIFNVICMNKEIRDKSSVKYSKFFYTYLSDNFDFKKSHDYAKNSLNLKADDTIFTVEFITKTNI